MKLKICGLTCRADIEAVNEAMPDYAGFVFAESRRQVTGREAQALAAMLAPSVKRVGVFVDAPQEETEELVQKGIIDYIQLHGAEPPSYVEGLKRRVKAPIIKALRMDAGAEAGFGGEGSEAGRMAALILCYEQAGVDYFLFDNGAGGTGERFDWRRIPAVQKPYFLAGGLNVDNVGEALKRTKAYALDVSSGVETDGKKDREKILRFVRTLRTQDGGPVAEGI